MVTVPKFWLKKKKKNPEKKSQILGNFETNKKKHSKFTHIQMKNHAKKEKLVEIQCFYILQITLLYLSKKDLGM